MNILTSIYRKIFAGPNKTERPCVCNKGKAPHDVLASLSFCEACMTTTFSPWHLRRHTDTKKTLCGFVQSWDIQVPVTFKQLAGDHVCKGCLTVCLNEVGNEGALLVEQWKTINS